MGIEMESKQNNTPVKDKKTSLEIHSSFLDVTADLRSQFAKEFANPDANANFAYQDLCFEVTDKSGKKKQETKTDEPTKPKNAKKQIIQNISGSIKAGEMLAILGPSGAGKTTLLNMFTLEAADGTGYGTLSLNGTPLKRENFVRNCYYVPQEFSLYAFLTPRETLTYAAALFSKDAQHIERRVNTLLKVMGLEACADTKVGNAFFTGLSGGQKKRLSVAVALLSQPLVLFLDEPTSGLDAAAAAGIMQFLRDLASMANIMIICTIHQPSTDVFYAFDKVMLLANGQLAYQGSADNVVPYFKSIGHIMPQNSNPAEWILDLVNDEFTSPIQVEKILLAWSNHEQQSSQQYKQPTKQPSARDVSKSQHADNAPGFSSQLWTLMKRHALLIARDPTIYTGRCIIYMVMAIFFSIIYIDQRDHTQTQVLNKMWLSLWFVGPAASLAVIAVFATNQEFKSVKNEIKNGMIHPIPYILCNICLQIPMMTLITWIAYLIPVYAISNFDPPQLPVFLMFLTVNFLIFEAVANQLAVQFSNFLVGMLGVMNMWFSSFLFSGIMVQQNDVPWPFRAFMYILPMKYSLQGLLYTEFHELHFSGTVTFNTQDPNNANQTAHSPRGFYCPDVQSQQCYGPTGLDALDSLHVNWGLVSSDNNTGMNFGILIAMYAIYKLSFAMQVYQKSTAAATLKAPIKQNKQPQQPTTAITIEDQHDSNMNVIANEQDRTMRQQDFVREFANPDQNAEFVFENVFYEVPDPKNKKQIKQIIKGVTGGVKAGQVLTIMGPSGAGKTTLLNALTLENNSGTCYGSISLNGRPMTREMFVQNCYYVPQYPALYAFLTPRETLTITAKLFASESTHDTDAVIEARVNTLLEVVGLQSCADIKIGNEFFLGISGGQKKRLSVAVALLSRPLVLFLDEPTTGLDAAAAAGLMKLLQQLATTSRILIVATIHQPSAQVFASFDNIMLLARGQTAYQGPAHQVAPYFASIGHPMPETATAAEYMLDLINDEFTETEKVNAVVAEWSQLSRQANSQASHIPRPIRGASMFHQILVLLKRQGMLVIRDPLLYIGRMIAYLFTNLFFTAVYEAARDRTQTRIVPRMFYDMWCIGTTASMALVIVFGQNREMNTIKNEVKNGMISPLAYLISNTILQLPMLFLMVIVGFLIPFYGIMDSNPRNMGEMLCIITAMLWSFEALAELLAVQFDNFLIGMFQFLNFWFSSFLFCGVIAAEGIVPWPFKLLLYVSPLRYGLETLVYLDFQGDTFGGAVPLITPDKNTGKFYTCPDDTSGGNACFGYLGTDVLSSLHANFDTIDNNNRTLRDILICLLIGFGIKLMYVFLLYTKVTTVSLPKSSDGKQSQAIKLSDIKNIEQFKTKATPSSTSRVATPVATPSPTQNKHHLATERSNDHLATERSNDHDEPVAIIPTATDPDRHASEPDVVFHFSQQ